MRGGECVRRQRNPFEKIQSQTNLSPSEIYKVADSVKNADFSDEKTVGKLVRQLAEMTNKRITKEKDEQTVRQIVKQFVKMANKRITKEKEDQLVQAITQNKMPMDMQSLKQMFKKLFKRGKLRCIIT